MSRLLVQRVPVAAVLNPRHFTVCFVTGAHQILQRLRRLRNHDVHSVGQWLTIRAHMRQGLNVLLRFFAFPAF